MREFNFYETEILNNIGEWGSGYLYASIRYDLFGLGQVVFGNKKPLCQFITEDDFIEYCSLKDKNK